MAGARSTYPPLLAFGEWLEDCRGTRSREAISRQLKRLGATLGGSTLAQYEKGRVWAPDPVVLYALAQLYDEPVTRVLQLLRANRKAPDATLSGLLEAMTTSDTASSNKEPDGVSVDAYKAQIDLLTDQRDGAYNTVAKVLIELRELVQRYERGGTARGTQRDKPRTRHGA